VYGGEKKLKDCWQRVLPSLPKRMTSFKIRRLRAITCRRGGGETKAEGKHSENVKKIPSKIVAEAGGRGGALLRGQAYFLTSAEAGRRFLVR